MKLFLFGIACSLALLGSTGRSFEENRGQAGAAGADVQFLARDRGRQVFFTSREVVWAPADGPAIRLRFPGAAGPAKWRATGGPVGQISYAIGNDRSRWVHGARQFDRIVWPGAYPGIDIVFYWRQDRLEYDFLVAPRADPGRIRIAWSGAPARLAADGSISVAGGLIQQLAPVAYQGAQKIPGRFLASGPEFQLRLGRYDRNQPLLIDPVLELSTYLGGENDDAVTHITADLVAGTTASVQFPGAAPGSRRDRDIFVRGIGNPASGSVQLYGTYVFGGTGDDELGGAVFLTGRRTLVVAGTTRSTDFLSTGQERPPLAGISDGFLAEFQFFNQFDGLNLTSVRLIGGSGEDRILSLVGESSWYIYAGETNSPDLPNANNAYSGGFDGFFGHSLYPNVLRYLGGPEDDRILATGFTFSNNVTFAGETRSAAFPHQQPDAPALQGASDAFLSNVIFPPFFWVSTEVRISSWLLGGSGEDRITALTPRSTNPSLAFAGVTTSPDLPVRNAAQPQFAGESDAFAGVWRPGEIEWLTYLGGSGVEEATGVARNSTGDLFLSGWTRSTDLPTVIPFQGQPGGGEDAFHAIVGPGAIRTLTYFGGDGDDRASALWLVKDGVARVGGWTKSTNLPLKNEWQNGRGQGSEGFLVEIGSSYLYTVSQVALAKDGAIVIPSRVPQSAVGQPITYRSSDPSKVRLHNGITSGDEVTAPLGTSVFAEGLAEAGEVEVTISSPGFTSTVCLVKLYPGALLTGINPPALHLWSRPTPLFSVWGPLDPATNRPLTQTPGAPVSSTPRSGFRLPPLNWTSSDESVVRVNRTAGPFESFEALVAGPGETILRAQAAGLPVWPADGLAVKVAGFSVTANSTISLGKDLQAALPFALDPVPNLQQPRRGLLTARSEDPSRLLVSLDPNQPGAALVSAPLFTATLQRQNIWLQALAGEGEVRVFLSSPEFQQEIVTVVRLERARLRWGQFRMLNQPVVTVVRPLLGEATTLTFQLESASGDLSVGRRPGVPDSLWSVSNSAAAIVETSRATTNLSSDRLLVTGLAPGSATLTLKPVSATDIELVNPTVEVQIADLPTNRFTAPPRQLTLGKDLQSTVVFRYNGPAGGVSATSENPSAVLLSTTSSREGQTSVDLNPSSNSTGYTFVVQGLRDAGESTVLIRYPGGEYRLRILAAPSGIGLRSASAGQGFDQSFDAQAYWLDGATGIPISRQAPRPGKRFEFTVRTSDPNLRLSRTTAAIENGNSNANISVTLPPFGQEAELIVEAEGQTLRQPLRRASRTIAAPSSTPLMLDTVTSIRLSHFGWSGSGGGRVRAISALPEAVSVSLSPTEPGAPSVEWAPADSASTIYLHGLRDSGAVAVRIEGEGVAPVEITTVLSPLRLQWNISGWVGASGFTLAPGDSLTGVVTLGNFTLRPGAERRTLRLRTTAANVATVSPASFELGGTTQSWNVTVQAKEEGQTDLLAETDRGGPEGAPPLGVTVRSAPSTPSAPSVLTLGGNTQVTLPLSLTQNPNGAIITVRSSDPARVVVSRSQAALGTGSVAVAVQAGQLLAGVQLQALASDGEVTITASVPGQPEQQWRVQLTPAWFRLRLEQSGRLRAGERTSLIAVLEPTANGNSARLRPGLANLALRVVATDPAIVRLGAATFPIFDSGDLGPVSLEATAAGDTTLRLEQPAGFGPAPEGGGDLLLRVGRPQLFFGCGNDRVVILGKDAQVGCQVGGAPEGTVIEAVSSDPSRLLLTSDPLTLGTARQTIRLASRSALTLQSLASSGTVDLLLTAPGFEDLRLSVVLRRSEIRPQSESVTITRGATREFGLIFTVPDPNGFNFNSAMVRAGATVQVQATFTPSGIASAQPATVTIAPNTSQTMLMLRGDAVGGTLLQLTSPGGYVNRDLPPIPVVVQ